MEATSASVAVVDTNAIVRGVRLENIAARCVSTREVQAEVRDKQSRHTLATLPFGLETREPDEQSVAAVRRFATLTGDAAVLSGVDTRLLALALCLEKEAHGGAHLRDKPPPPAAVKRRHTPAVPLPGWDFVTHPEEWEPLDREEEAQAARLALAQVGGTAAAENACAADNDAGHPPSRVGTRVQALIAEEPATTNEHAPAREEEEEEPEDDGGGWEAAVSRTTRIRRAKRAEYAAAEAASACAAAAELAARNAARLAAGEPLSDSDSGQESDESESESESSGDEDHSTTPSPPLFLSSVALVTADFAMQNVALQMGLRVVAPDGLRITRLQRWVLRCHACGGVTRDTSRHFCGRCGNAAMQRVSLTVDAGGVEHVGVRRRHNLRGTRYSLPAPKGGRYAVNPVLREDQLAMKRLPSRGNKPRQESDVFAAEFGPDTLFQREMSASQAPSLAQAGSAPVVGRGRNPNVRRHQLSNRRR